VYIQREKTDEAVGRETKLWNSMFLPGRHNKCVTYFKSNYAFEHSMRLVQNDIATNKGAQQLTDILTIN